MGVSDEQQRLLGELSMKALDHVENNFPDGASLDGAIIILDISFTGPDGEPATQVVWFPSSNKISYILGTMEAARLGIVKNSML